MWIWSHWNYKDYTRQRLAVAPKVWQLFRRNRIQLGNRKSLHLALALFPVIPAALETSYYACMLWLYCALVWLGAIKWRLPLIRDNVPPWWRSAMWFTKQAWRHKQRELADKNLFRIISRSLHANSSWMQVAWNDALKVNLLGEPTQGGEQLCRTENSAIVSC